ncbi:MAG: thermosome subunit beta [Thermoplasmata archaeon]
MPNVQQPVIILKEGSERNRGKEAMKNNIAAAKAVADAVRSTLGPKGMDKMLVDSMGDIVITNDGVTILKEVEIEHPAAKMIVEVAKTQDQECGDGTTTAVVLAGELLKQSEELIDQNIHPTIISSGYRMAASEAIRILEKLAIPIHAEEKDMLQKIASTALYSKSAGAKKDLLSKIAVDAVVSVHERRGERIVVDKDNISIVKKHGGTLADTQLIQGIVIDKEPVHADMPREVNNAKIALLDAAFEVKKTEVDAKISIKEVSQLQRFLEQEEKQLKDMVEAVKKAGANVVFTQKGIDDVVQHLFAKAGIYAVRRIKKSDMDRLARATGARTVSKIAEITPEDLGSAGKVYAIKIGNDEMTFVTDCMSAKAVSVLIRGGSEHFIDEVERSLNDAIGVVATALEDGRIITGGGSTAMELAQALKSYAATVGGREQMAIDAFAQALEVIPKALAENAGYDPIDILLSLRKAHKEGKKHAGVSVKNPDKIGDMLTEQVIEPIRVGKQAISSATEAAIMILRIDDVIAAKKQSQTPPSGGKGDSAGED